MTDSFEILEAVSDELPPYDKFFDFITQKVDITQAQYETASQVYRNCGCHSLKDYMLRYLKLDIYLLADVFESFRETAIVEDMIDPLHYYSIPGVSWDSALKSMPRPLELLSDHTMYNFFESGIRGGMTFDNAHP